MNPWNIFQVIGQCHHIRRFTLVVELLQKSVPKFFQNSEELVALAGSGVPFKECRQLLKHFQVLRDLFADSRSLHFDDHRAAVPQCRGMDLAERSRC